MAPVLEPGTNEFKERLRRPDRRVPCKRLALTRHLCPCLTQHDGEIPSGAHLEAFILIRAGNDRMIAGGNRRGRYPEFVGAIAPQHQTE